MSLPWSRVRPLTMAIVTTANSPSRIAGTSKRGPEVPLRVEADRRCAVTARYYRTCNYTVQQLITLATVLLRVAGSGVRHYYYNMSMTTSHPAAIPMILAHAGIHAHGAGHILRLGPLLPLALVACIAGLSRGLPWRGAVRGAAAIALGAAGLLHLALFPEHLHEGSVAGLFFLASAAAELLVAVLLVSRPGPLVTRSVVGIVVVLLVVYVAARLIQLPFTSGREGVDAIGLVTKAVEIFGAGLAVIGDRPQLPRVPSPTMVSAMALGLVAFASHPLFGEGPALLHAALSIGTATIGAMALGGRSSSRLAVAVTDGAVLALLLRGPWAVTALAAPAVAELLRAAARRAQVRVASPAGLALVLCLVLPQLDGRLEVLHVGHPSETLAALVVFLLAGILGVAVWHRGQLPVVVGFVVAHLGGQALRLLADRTSFEAVEIPATSLGLLLVATVLLADADLRGAREVLVVVGVASGVLDVILRDRAVPYAPIVAIVVVSTLVGAWEAWRGPQPRAPEQHDLLRPPQP